MDLMIGYGNPLRADDGLGPILAEVLGEGWEIITSTQLLPELAEPISRAKRVVFLDASVGDIPGDVTCTVIQPQAAEGAFTHNVTPASLLAASLALYETAPKAILIGVTGASFEYSTELSPAIAALLPDIITTARRMIVAAFG